MASSADARDRECSPAVRPPRTEGRDSTNSPVKPIPQTNAGGVASLAGLPPPQDPATQGGLRRFAGLQAQKAPHHSRRPRAVREKRRSPCHSRSEHRRKAGRKFPTHPRNRLTRLPANPKNTTPPTHSAPPQAGAHLPAGALLPGDKRSGYGGCSPSCMQLVVQFGILFNQRSTLHAGGSGTLWLERNAIGSQALFVRYQVSGRASPYCLPSLAVGAFTLFYGVHLRLKFQ